MSGRADALILRASDRPAVAWKNGGGLTREIAAYPPGSDLGSFEWRVSIAEVRAGGPFSQFPGVERRMVVLAGTLELAIDGREAIRVSPDSAPVSFAGDVPAFATPRGQPVTDLNVMTRRDRFDSQLQWRAAAAVTEVTVRADTTLIVALSDLGLRCAGQECGMSQLDAALIEGAAHCQVIARAAPHASFYLIELRARHRERARPP